MAKILLIDDDDLVRQVITRQLERAGHAVSAAAHGGKGVEAFETQTFDIVITDILMPEKEGLETIQTLRRLAPAIPIIAMTGGPVSAQLSGKIGVDYLGIAEQLGTTKTIRKPFRGAQMLAVIAACLAVDATSQPPLPG
ncbi:MAG: response regulator [Alphaproteobacteria bacterium]|nr:response regulator [Alphaproteobacteria bacterium]